MKHQEAQPLPPAIVIGLDSMQGIQTARTLARHGIPVYAIANDPAHHCCKTRVCEEIFFANVKSEEFVDTLLEIADRFDEKPVLFPCEDETARVVARRRSELVAGYHLALADIDVLEMMSDKLRFYDFATANGFRMPMTMSITSREEALVAANQMKFPAVLKPAARTRQWEENTMSKAYRLENADEFFSTYSRVSEWTDKMLLQQWIPGGEEQLISCNCYFNEYGKPLCTFVAKKLRQWPPYVGNSSLGIECRDDFVMNETIRLFESVGYHGLGYVEFKIDSETGEHYIVEPNLGRPTGRSGIAEAGGVELLYTMYCDVLGLPLPVERTQMYRDTKWVDLRHDFQSALYYWRNGKITLREWRESWKGRKAHTYFSWSDPAPFLYDLLGIPKRLFSRSEGHKRDYMQVPQSHEAKPST